MDWMILTLLDIGDLLPLEPLWSTALGFVVIMVATVGAIGVGSRNMAVGAMGAFLTFVYFASHAEITFLENLMYVTVVLVIVGTSFKLWRLEGFESGGS